MHILYYITSHGYGHAVRSAAICNRLVELAPDLRITVKSGVPVQFFDEELTARHDVVKGGFDVGCLQSDGVTVLVEETLMVYSDIAANNKKSLDGEARRCAADCVDCIVSDITPFAFDVADRAGIPSVAVGNFTWHDIYAPYVARYPEYGPMLSEMAEQYRKATLALALYPASPMPVFDRKVSVPIVGRKGRNRKSEIFDMFGIDKGKRLGLIYTGNFGLDGIDWRGLEDLGGWEFVGVYPLPGAPKNFHVIAKSQFRYEDLSASADVIVGKMGYGVFSESLLNGVPLIYLPREDFSEFQVLDAEAKRLGNGVCVNADAFVNVRWDDVLDKAISGKKIAPVDDYGVMICAEEIIKIASSHPVGPGDARLDDAESACPAVGSLRTSR